MFKKLFTIFGLLTSIEAHAWFCEEAASVREDQTIRACGTATASDKTVASAAAFQAALEEFKRVCDASTDCDPNSVIVTPRRTVCSLQTANVTCTRLVEFEIPRTTVRGSRVVANVTRMERGMSKGRLVETFGLPAQVRQGMSMRKYVRTFWGAPEGEVFIYVDDRFCLRPGCLIYVYEGTVVGWIGVRPEYVLGREER